MDLVVRVEAPARPGETVFGRSFSTVAGGKGLNQAVAAARAAGRVEFMGCVGRDAFGDDLIAVLDAEGIARPLLRRVPTATGTAHITVDSTGQNSIIVVAGANGEATPDDVTDEVAGRFDWLVTQLELPEPAVAAALARAHKRGARTCLTPAPARPLSESLLRSVDLLVPNELEAAILSGEGDPARAAARLSLLCPDVVVTVGGDGALWAREGVVVRHVPARPTEVIDTTAAGDTFVGVLVAELASGAGFPAALQAATVAASLSVSHEGATASMPYRPQIDAVLNSLGEHVS